MKGNNFPLARSHKPSRQYDQNIVVMSYQSRGSKRRWASADDGDGNAPSADTTTRRRRYAAAMSSSQWSAFHKNDLSQKTTANADGRDYGYLSSDDEQNGSTNAGGKEKERMSRKEQRSVRSFPRVDETLKRSTSSASACDSLEINSIPNPTGWTQLAPKRRGEESTSSQFFAEEGENGCVMSTASEAATNKNKTNNPYAQSRPSRNATRTPLSVARTLRSTKTRTSKHVVVAISENLARETCVASLDASRPTFLHITKQGNGQTYAETLTLLKMLSPDEVLLNEGRKNSQLAAKIMQLFGEESMKDGMDALVVNDTKTRSRVNKRRNHTARKRGSNVQDVDDSMSASLLSSSECKTNTVVKFVPRSYFDQTKGAELLRKLAREDTFTLVEEYILLSSSYAVIQYAQLCLGAGFARGSLAMDINVGGNHRMNIDRTTMANLELLVNAKTGRTTNSLVGTIDCTKTSVGGRLLRTNLMAPPTRLDTIHARLDLVDSLLEDEEFFYVVMEHLEDLPDVDKMLSYVVLTPKKRWNGSGNGALFGITERQTVTARIASKGISALVCIKSTLSAIPSFAHCLEVQLKELDERDGRRGQGVGTSNIRNDVQDDDFTAILESELSRNESEDVNSFVHSQDDDACMTQDSSLQIGLGTASNKNTSFSSKLSRHQLLGAILLAMKQPALSRVLSAVTNIFTESTVYSKNRHAMRHQECFALKPNTDGMMDVLRKAFLANVDDIYRLADEYSESYDINVQVKETSSRGYYLAVSADLVPNLPQIFIQPVKSGRFIHCTTEEVYSLNSRAQENVQDLLLMTHSRIQEVLQVARDNYDCLASLSDAIALLDMCHCFADNVASSRMPWCRPILSDNNCGLGREDNSSGSGAIAIRNGRYPIDVTASGVSTREEDFVPNDCYSSVLQNFTVITGVNASGKSTYLKQIALIVILAHCGSYVPAEEALLPIRELLLTRIGTADDQEHNISTFLLEMKETALICNSTTEKSLFLLDELGRATSNEDGVAIAWSVSEHLLTKRAMTFFVTHYPQISKLADIYPNVQNQHLGSQIAQVPNESESSISYTHKIMPGPCKVGSDYGVEMTATCGWPSDAIQNARKIRQFVQEKIPGADICDSGNSSGAESVRKAHNVLCDLAKHLLAMKDSEEKLSKDAKKHYLQVSCHCIPNDPF